MKKFISVQLLLIFILAIWTDKSYAQIGSWISLDEMPSERGCAASAVLNNKVYIIGGFADSDETAMTKVIAYDAVADSFIMDIADLPVPLGRVKTEVLNGKIYAVGGHSENWGDNMLPSLYEYDPLYNSWTQKADMLQPRFNHSTAVLNGKLVVLGGRTVAFPAPVDNSVESYDPDTDSWTSISPMNYIRAGHASAVVNDKLYVLGGGTSSVLFPVIERYDPLTNEWLELTEMPNRWGHGAVVLDNQIYFFGGANYVHGLPDIWRYDVENDSLIDLEAIMPDSLINPSYGLLEDAAGDKCIYVLGGTTPAWWLGGTGPRTSAAVLKYCPDRTSSVLGDEAVSELKFTVFPNPVSNWTNIAYELENSTNVNISIFDQSGCIVRTLLDEFQASGPHKVTWNLSDVAVGVYYCKITTKKYIATRKVIIHH